MFCPTKVSVFLVSDTVPVKLNLLCITQSALKFAWFESSSFIKICLTWLILNDSTALIVKSVVVPFSCTNSSDWVDALDFAFSPLENIPLTFVR